MNTIAKCLATLGLALLMQPAAFAQESKSIPDDVYYLMPEFGNGMVYFAGQRPAQGKLNICALDNTLRFMDAEGKELAASDIDNILMVRIDTVSFVHNNGFFYRIYPVSEQVSIALKREVKTNRGAKKGAYGTTSQTSAINQKNTLYADGIAYRLNSDDVTYNVQETMFLYKDNSVIPINKRSLKRVFPAHKEDIDAFFASGSELPSSAPDLIAVLRPWTE